jgi:hypothetical protein
MGIFSSKKREFLCPHCNKPVVVVKVKEDGSATLRHPQNGCKATASDLLRGYVLMCQPKPRFPKFGEIADALWEKHEKERNGG